ncbi:MAG: hypothetical protein QM662_12195 [Gordonia sp. (in: high G+C Gram-positive bacteria)]
MPPGSPPLHSGPHGYQVGKAFGPPPAIDAGAPTPATGPAPRRSGGKGLLLLVAALCAVVVLAVLGVGAWWLFLRSDPDPDSRASAAREQANASAPASAGASSAARADQEGVEAAVDGFFTAIGRFDFAGARRYACPESGLQDQLDDFETQFGDAGAGASGIPEIQFQVTDLVVTGDEATFSLDGGALAGLPDMASPGKAKRTGDGWCLLE